jgi:hypothetical protein
MEAHPPSRLQVESPLAIWSTHRQSFGAKAQIVCGHLKLLPDHSRTSKELTPNYRIIGQIFQVLEATFSTTL